MRFSHHPVPSPSTTAASSVKMNFNNGDHKASFFKILLNDSVDYLPLPTTFAKEFLEKGNNRKQTLVLKPKSGVKWRVKYLKNEDRYYFMDGWLNFIKDNRLQVGDFLVFWLLSASPKSTFQVFCYAPNGCLKHPVGFSAVGKKRCVKDETPDNDDDDNSSQKVHKSITRVLRKSYVHQLPMATGFLKETGLDRYDNVRLRTNEGKIWKVGVSKYGKIRLPNLTRGWNDFWKGNEMNMGNTFQITHVKGNLIHVHVIKSQKRKNL